MLHGSRQNALSSWDSVCFPCRLGGIVDVARRLRIALRKAGVICWIGVVTLLTVLTSVAATATERTAGPGDYRAALWTLKPGDTLRLKAGVYTEGLSIAYLNGTEAAPIVITGPATGAPALFLARPADNTVSLVNTSYVTIRHLTLEGQGHPVDAVKAEGYSDWAHHIVLEDLIISGHGHDQQTVGISSKCPAWGWEVRRNAIRGAGTGMYFGDSDGTAPFFAGLIEHNLVVDSLGYNLQIKHQNGRLLQEGSTTTIRHNVFSKLHQARPSPNARPNVLVGHWPDEGPGSNDHYEIYGNLFYQNPHEALFQGEGNLALYNNLFVNDHGDAIHIQPHNGIPKTVDIFFNTVLARDKGIVIRTARGGASYQQTVAGNAVFAAAPLTGGRRLHNTLGRLSDAVELLVQPAGQIGELDLRPRPDRLQGTALALTWLSRYANWQRDFDGCHRDLKVRGAYGGDTLCPRWRPALAAKP
jgi:hypothetical protein